jgi:hypothetical protein
MMEIGEITVPPDLAGWGEWRPEPQQPRRPHPDDEENANA